MIYYLDYEDQGKNTWNNYVGKQLEFINVSALAYFAV